MTDRSAARGVHERRRRRPRPRRPVVHFDNVGDVDQARRDEDLFTFGSLGTPSRPSVRTSGGGSPAPRSPRPRRPARSSARYQWLSSMRRGRRASRRRGSPLPTRRAQASAVGIQDDVSMGRVLRARNRRGACPPSSPGRLRTTWPARTRRRGSRPTPRAQVVPGVRSVSEGPVLTDRHAMTHWRNTCSIGWPMPRSAPSDSTPSSSDSRTRAPASASRHERTLRAGAIMSAAGGVGSVSRMLC